MPQMTIQQAFSLASRHQQSGRFGEAIQLYRQILEYHPNHADAYCNLGTALISAGLLDEAIIAYRQSILLNPNDADSHNNLGNALKLKGKPDEAIALYRRALALAPDYALAANNLGVVLAEKGLFDEAIAAYRQAIANRSNYAEAQNNLGCVLRDAGELDQAIASFEHALHLQPGFAGAHGNLAFALHFHPGYQGEAIFDEHLRWNQRHAEPLKKFIRSHDNDRRHDRRLRIGYVSGDFRDHPVGRFLLPLLRHHDHDAYEIVCYSDVVITDQMTQNLRACADAWHDVAGHTDDRIAEAIRTNHIDILIDLAGHTAGNHLGVFARKPAPVEVTYLGYPGTTGLSQIDYRLSDHLADPPGKTEKFHSEKLWRLPVCNWCYGEPENSPRVRPARPEGPICFGTFNKFAKASPVVLDLWAGDPASAAFSPSSIEIKRTDRTKCPALHLSPF